MDFKMQRTARRDLNSTVQLKTRRMMVAVVTGGRVCSTGGGGSGDGV